MMLVIIVVALMLRLLDDTGVGLELHAHLANLSAATVLDNSVVQVFVLAVEREDDVHRVTDDISVGDVFGTGQEHASLQRLAVDLGRGTTHDVAPPSDPLDAVSQ